jgi:hypothetical protein
MTFEHAYTVLVIICVGVPLAYVAVRKTTH